MMFNVKLRDGEVFWARFSGMRRDVEGLGSGCMSLQQR